MAVLPHSRALARHLRGTAVPKYCPLRSRSRTLLTMRVEMAGEAQRPDRVSEDYAAATPEALVLLDGSSSPAAMESGCEHGTAWYARRLGVHLLARLVDRPDRTMAQCLSDSIAETASLHGARCDLAHPNTRPPWSSRPAATGPRCSTWS
jgi:hypothetical protein